jgi:multisubunit Na+/H+ antiporter MnhG subunit
VRVLRVYSPSIVLACCTAVVAVGTISRGLVVLALVVLAVATAVAAHELARCYSQHEWRQR